MFSLYLNKLRIELFLNKVQNHGKILQRSDYNLSGFAVNFAEVLKRIGR